MNTPAYVSRFPAAPAATGAVSQSLISFVEDRWGHDRRYAMDTGKARRELGFKTLWDIDRGLRDTVAWYLDNDAWWRSILADERESQVQ
jgi:dTDP-glucose 4,6-dehydratase